VRGSAEPSAPTHTSRVEDVAELARALSASRPGQVREHLYRRLLVSLAPDIKAGIFSVGIRAHDVDVVHNAVNYAIRQERIESPRWSGERPYTGYVRQMARRQALSHLRGQRWREQPTSDVPEQAVVDDTNQTLVDRQMLLRALEVLDDDEREVVVLRGLQGLTFPQLAEELDQETEAVKARFYRACRKLRAQLPDGEMS